VKSAGVEDIIFHGVGEDSLFFAGILRVNGVG
jgi:hypothetical protein